MVLFPIHTHKSGFTMIEVLMYIAVSTLIIGAITSSVLYFYRSNTNVLEQTLQVENARRGVEFMTRDIRESAYSDLGGFPLASIASTSLTIYTDLDRDQSVEKVRYYLEGTVLKKSVVNASGTPLSYNDGAAEVSIISQYIRNGLQGVPIFRYYTSTSTEVTNGAVKNVSFITIALIVNVNPERLPGEFTLRSSATLRNLKTNL